MQAILLVDKTVVLKKDEEKPKSKSDYFLQKSNSGKVQKFNAIKYYNLQRHLLDLEKRVNFQKKQAKFYQQAREKQKAIRKSKIGLDHKSFFNRQELDALDYFNDIGFYKKYQDLEYGPNIYDTRHTFLLKMHNDRLPDSFMNSVRNMVF